MRDLSFSEVYPKTFWSYNQGKTAWLDSACADCPGFLILGAAPAPASTFRLGASDCAPGLAFCFISEPPKRGRKTGAARKLSKSAESVFDTF